MTAPIIYDISSGQQFLLSSRHKISANKLERPTRFALNPNPDARHDNRHH
jgi:hypothetical protein